MYHSWYLRIPKVTILYVLLHITTSCKSCTAFLWLSIILNVSHYILSVAEHNYTSVTPIGDKEVLAEMKGSETEGNKPHYR